MRRGRPRHPDLLTPREQEVLDLLRAGLTNRQIAERLGISLAGARYHVSEILAKLDVGSREEAAQWSPPPHRGWLGMLSALRAIPTVVRFGIVMVSVTGLATVLALARGDGARSTTDTAPPAAQRDATPERDPDLATFLQYEAQARDAANDVAPGLLLLQVNVNLQRGTPAPGGNAGPYTFRFTDPTRTLEIYVVGPDAAPGLPPWRVETMPSVNGPNTTAELDIRRLQASPDRVVAAIRGVAPVGIVLFGLTLYTYDVDLLWAAFGSLPDGILRCEVADGPPPLRASCPWPPSQPPRSVPVTP